MSRWLAMLALAALPALAWAADTVPLAQGGVPRSYQVHLPPQQAGDAALPLLIALHGTSMRAGDMFEYTDLPQVADRAGFVLVSPAALGAAFNDLAASVSGTAGAAGPILAGIIAIVGHGLNLVLGIAGGIVHGLRLNFIEFFNWAVWSEGRPFRAFARTESEPWRTS